MKRVVILGGGYVGIDAYRALCRNLGGRIGQDVEITVVSSDNCHTFHGFTGEVLTGILPAAHTLTPLRELLPRANFVQGTAQSVDIDRQTVLVKVGDRLETFHYDHLLFGIGSRDPFERIRGLQEYGWRLKQVYDMQALRDHLIRTLEQADATSDPDRRDDLLHFVIAGGGFAGVEMCAAIAEWFKTAKRQYPVLCKHQPRLTLVHSGSELLEVLRPRYTKLADYAQKTLEQYGVQFVWNAKVCEITPQGAHLENGRFLHSQTVIVTAGISRLPIPGTESLPRDATGRLLTDTHLNVKGYSNLWAGGDTAKVKHPSEAGDCPSNALFAMKHGMCAGDNIARSLNARALRHFRFTGMGQAAGLGIGRGIAELYGIQMTGPLAWLLRLGFFIWFMPSMGQSLRILLDWLLLPLTGRYMVPLSNPRQVAATVPTLEPRIPVLASSSQVAPRSLVRPISMALWNE